MSSNLKGLNLSNLIVKHIDLTESNFGVSSIDSEVINTKEITFPDLIANDVDLTLTNVSANQNGYYTPVDQSAYQGQFITQIGIDIQVEGQLTLFFLENVNTAKCRVAFSQVLQVTKDKKWYDVNKFLATSMSIAICNPNVDNALFKYTSTSSKKFYYSSGALNVWATVLGDLNIGVKIKNTNGIHHPLKNKKISIIGDSISTYWDYNASKWGRYPIGDVQNAKDTWWMQVILQTGAKLVQNNSIGGTLVTQLQVSDTGSLQARLNVISTDTDICFIAMGTNDIGNSRNLGVFDPTKATFDLSNFSDAVCNAIVNLQKNYPTTKFVWVTPLKRFDGVAGAMPYTKNNETIQTYTNRLIEICNFYGWEYIDMTNLGVNYINQNQYFADGLHPNKVGMYLMADYIKNSFK